MKLILLEDVTNLGRRGETVEVKPGFARNFLLKQNKALLPTDPSAKNLIVENKRQGQAKKAEKDLLSRKISSFDGQKIEFKVRTNKQGEPYKAVQVKEIAKKIGIEEKFIKTETIHSLGEFPVTLKSPQVQAQITIVVRKEE